MISVLVVDDQDVIRLGLRTLLEREEGFTVAGEAPDGLTAVAAAKEKRPDVILMDVRMPGVDGLEATRRITADPDLEHTRIIVLATSEQEEYVFHALRSGASGLLFDDATPAELLRAIRQVADGGASLSPSATRTLIREFVTQFPRPVQPQPHLDALTEREREVVGLVAEGLTNDEIADRLVVSPATARTHVSRAMIKVGARDRAQLVTFAYQSGLAA